MCEEKETEKERICTEKARKKSKRENRREEKE